MSGSLGHVAGSRNASAVPHALHAIELRLYWKGAKGKFFQIGQFCKNEFALFFQFFGAFLNKYLL